MKSIHHFCNLIIKITCTNSHSRTRCTWIINCMSNLRRTFWINTHTNRCIFHNFCISFKLCFRVKYNMITYFCKFFYILGTIGRRIYMILQTHFFFPKSCFIKTTCCCTTYIFSYKWIFFKA